MRWKKCVNQTVKALSGRSIECGTAEHNALVIPAMVAMLSTV